MNEKFYERIDKIIASTGKMSRKDAKKAAKDGRITVNGKAVKDCSVKACEHDDVRLDGSQIIYRRWIYVMLNKPKGYVCSTDDPSSPIVNLLLSDELQNLDLFSIGRLDKNTTGLVILTNDGALTHKLLSPTKHVEKEYTVSTEKTISTNTVDVFEEGATLEDGYKCLPASLKISGANTATIIIREGKYHQIKRMFESVGNKVTKLERIRIGNLKLDFGLKQGEFKILSDEEILLLRGE